MNVVSVVDVVAIEPLGVAPPIHAGITEASHAGNAVTRIGDPINPEAVMAPPEHTRPGEVGRQDRGTVEAGVYDMPRRGGGSSPDAEGRVSCKPHFFDCPCVADVLNAENKCMWIRTLARVVLQSDIGRFAVVVIKGFLAMKAAVVPICSSVFHFEDDIGGGVKER